MTLRSALIVTAAATFGLAACGDGDDGDVAATDTVAVDTATGPLPDEADGEDDNVLLTVEVTGVRPGGGMVYVALQDEQSFPTADAAIATGQAAGDAAQVVVPIRNVEPGTYAVSAFQDADGNGAIEIASTGPTEPFGYSGGKQGGWPEFDLADFEVSGEGGRAVIALQQPYGRSE